LVLIITSDHAEKLHDLPDEWMTDILPIAKKIAIAQGFDDYNILQNNGRIAHQVSDRYISVALFMLSSHVGSPSCAFPCYSQANYE
jgi:hypothetical protein